MSRLLQADAVVAELLAGDSTIHVMGPREDGPDYGPEEAVCEPGVEHGPPVRIVYHPESVRLDGTWVCPRCGEGPPPPAQHRLAS